MYRHLFKNIQIGNITTYILFIQKSNVQSKRPLVITSQNTNIVLFQKYMFKNYLKIQNMGFITETIINIKIFISKTINNPIKYLLQNVMNLIVSFP